MFPQPVFEFLLNRLKKRIFFVRRHNFFLYVLILDFTSRVARFQKILIEMEKIIFYHLLNTAMSCTEIFKMQTKAWKDVSFKRPGHLNSRTSEGVCNTHIQRPKATTNFGRTWKNKTHKGQFHNVIFYPHVFTRINTNIVYN